MKNNLDLNVCDFHADMREPHDLIVVKRTLGGTQHHFGTYEHATQLLCRKCFKLFDYSAIVDFHAAHQYKGLGNV